MLQCLQGLQAAHWKAPGGGGEGVDIYWMLSAKQELLRQPILDVIDVIALNGIFLFLIFLTSIFLELYFLIKPLKDAIHTSIFLPPIWSMIFMCEGFKYHRHLQPMRWDRAQWHLWIFPTQSQWQAGFLLRKVPRSTLRHNFWWIGDCTAWSTIAAKYTPKPLLVFCSILCDTGKGDPGYIKSREDASSFTCSPVSEVVSYWPAKARLAGKEKKRTGRAAHVCRCYHSL